MSLVTVHAATFPSPFGTKHKHGKTAAQFLANESRFLLFISPLKRLNGLYHVSSLPSIWTRWFVDWSWFLFNEGLSLCWGWFSVIVRVFQCAVWCHSGVCHCNSHKRSDFWSHLRNGVLLRGLQSFNLTLSEIDAHLRHAGSLSDTCGHTHSCWISDDFINSLPSHFFSSSRHDAAELQTRARCAVLFLPKGETSRGIWCEPTKPASPCLWVSDAMLRNEPLQKGSEGFV